ncbi:MAG: rRNA pseudouridine synthase [Thiotrichales bacterium]|nr:rRNA pseudouridine synthase [Thiotrichales bacterium]
MNKPTQVTEKLQKILARAGFGSRRSVEMLIEQGLVKVNNRVAKLGDRAGLTDKIKVREQLLEMEQMEAPQTQVILYNKPEGLICSRSDEKGRETIFGQLPRLFQGRWISIGRLDLNTSGLLILTNNGELANRLTHPSYQIEREYTVRVFGEVTPEILNQLQKGVQLEDGPAKFERIASLPAEEDALNRWFRVVIKEGRNREVRRLWEAVGLQVSRLHRIRYGEFSMPRNLAKGKTEALSWKQVNQLLRSVELPEEIRPDLAPRARFDKTALAKKDAKKSDRTWAGRDFTRGNLKANGFKKPHDRKESFKSHPPSRRKTEQS